MAEEAKQLKLELLNAKISVESAYREFYFEKKKCDGLNAELAIVGTRPSLEDDQCLAFPIAPEAIQLYTQKNQL